MLYVIVFAITLVVSQVVAGLLMWKLLMKLMTNEKFMIGYIKKMTKIMVKLQEMEFEEDEEEE